MHQYLEYLVTPLTAGIVGYVTNWLAIKMLFRPFKPKWYTFGWQGIIPRTRADLAINVANVVGAKLVTAEEINKKLSQPEVKEAFTSKIKEYLFVDDNLGSKTTMHIHAYATSAIKSLFSNVLFAKTFDKKANEIINRIADDYFSGEKEGEFFVYLNMELQKLSQAQMSVKNLFHADADSIADAVVKAFNPALIDLLSNKTLAEELTAFLIRYKHIHKEEGFKNKMIFSFMSNFFTDNKIEELTGAKLPEIAHFITTDVEIQERIKESIKDKQAAFILVLWMLTASNINASSFFDYLKDLAKIIENNRGTDTKVEIKVSSFVLENIDKTAEGENFADAEKASSFIAGGMLGLMKDLFPRLISMVDITGLVKDKINTLELEEVENILFSFMGKHFKWINILGFVLGFIIGTWQVVFMLIKNNPL